MSELYPNKGTNKYYRAYVEVQKEQCKRINSRDYGGISSCVKL